MKKFIIRKAAMIVLFAISALFAFSALFMTLWNATLPMAIHAGTITFFQAMGILVLAKLMFGGFKGRRPWGAGLFMKMHLWRKWAQMSPEQRAEFKQQRHCHNMQFHVAVDADGLYHAPKEEKI
jgi:hypothetical protein